MTDQPTPPASVDEQQTVGYIYITHNDINDTQYVGQSIDTTPNGIRNYLGSGDYLTQDIRKYGRGSFHKKILDYYGTQVDLDYAEVLKIAEMRAVGVPLYNGGVGGPAADAQFVWGMYAMFGALPADTQEWFEGVRDHPELVKELLEHIGVPSDDAFRQELEQRFLITQDLRLGCPKCSAAAGAVCLTSGGWPSKNHAARRDALTALPVGERMTSPDEPAPSPPSREVDAEQLRRVRGLLGLDDIRSAEPRLTVVEGETTTEST